MPNPKEDPEIVARQQKDYEEEVAEMNRRCDMYRTSGQGQQGPEVTTPELNDDGSLKEPEQG